MFHVVFLVKKRPDMDLKAFSDYWIKEHTPFTAKVPGLRAYRCYPATGAESGEPTLDGVAICTFDSKEAWEAASQSDEFKAAIGDAPNFQDTAATTSIYAEEHIIV